MQIKTNVVIHPTDRPNFTIVNLGKFGLVYSYDTLIGLRINGKRYVTAEKFSHTTSKQQNYLKSGVLPYHEVSIETFDKIASYVEQQLNR